VQIASVQTLWARCVRTDKAPLPRAELIIVDEAHHIAAQTWRKILEAYPNARRIGLSATPCRSDGRGLGNYFDELIEGPQIPELIVQKHLVPTVYYAPDEPDLRGVETRQGDYVVNQLANRMNRDDLVGDIVSNWHKLAQGRKTLVFCVDVAHSAHVRNEFVKSGVRAEHVDGSTPKTERDAILARLASGETQVVCNCMVLTEGFDLPAIGSIMLARPTKQIGLFRQMAGRGLRPAPGKTNLILIDHSGAVYRHGLLEDRVEWTLDVTKRAENPRTQAALGRQHYGLSSAANVAPCAREASHARTAASCPSRDLTPSSSAKASWRASTAAGLFSRRIRTIACGGTPSWPALRRSVGISPAGPPTNTRKSSAVGHRRAPSRRCSRQLKCSPGCAAAISPGQRHGRRRLPHEQKPQCVEGPTGWKDRSAQYRCTTFFVTSRRVAHKPGISSALASRTPGLVSD
jgi:superfamily II DNA or RNA helicase